MSFFLTACQFTIKGQSIVQGPIFPMIMLKVPRQEAQEYLTDYLKEPLPSHGMLFPLAKSVTALPPHPSVNSLLKRGLDIVGGLVGLLLTGLVAIPVAVAIQLDDPGPIFYSQIRCGYRGRPFRIWKFRSMVCNADKLKHLVENQAQGLIFKNERDPRVTRIGRFLRRTSLDELPQFWNVLKGEMSLVGTRPPTLDEVDQYEPHHWQRLNVKPGMTGEWQVKGRSEVKDFEAVVEMDLAYQKRWSIQYDLQLILQTIYVVLRRKGAF